MKSQKNKFPLDDKVNWWRLPEELEALSKKVDNLLSSTYSREVITLPVPSLGDDVVVSANSLDTIILFAGGITENFNFNVTPSTNTSIGDRIYLMVKGVAGKAITTGNNLSPIQCGDDDTSIRVEPYMICHEMVYDGEKFTGIDNC